MGCFAPCLFETGRQGSSGHGCQLPSAKAAYLQPSSRSPAQCFTHRLLEYLVNRQQRARQREEGRGGEGERGVFLMRICQTAPPKSHAYPLEAKSFELQNAHLVTHTLPLVTRLDRPRMRHPKPYTLNLNPKLAPKPQTSAGSGANPPQALSP